MVLKVLLYTLDERVGYVAYLGGVTHDTTMYLEILTTVASLCMTFASFSYINTCHPKPLVHVPTDLDNFLCSNEFGKKV